MKTNVLSRNAVLSILAASVAWSFAQPISSTQSPAPISTAADPNGKLVDGASPGAMLELVPLAGGRKVRFDGLPLVVQNRIRSISAGGSIENIAKGTADGRTVYETTFTRR